jgi:hypothetical protein
MKAKNLQLQNVMFSTRTTFPNVIIDSVFILILSAGTTIVLIGEATNNFAVSRWVENMKFCVIAYGLLYLLLLTEVYFSRH